MSMISYMPTECSSMPTVAATHLQVALGDELADLLVGQHFEWLGDDELRRVDERLEAALELDERALGGVHDLLVDDLGVAQVHRAAQFERGRFGHALRYRAGTWSPPRCRRPPTAPPA